VVGSCRSCVDAMFICKARRLSRGVSPQCGASAASTTRATGVQELDQIHISSLILALNFWDSFFLSLTTNTETESEAVIEFEMP
jgi:hypothetical protein